MKRDVSLKRTGMAVPWVPPPLWNNIKPWCHLWTQFYDVAKTGFLNLNTNDILVPNSCFWLGLWGIVGCLVVSLASSVEAHSTWPLMWWCKISLDIALLQVKVCVCVCVCVRVLVWNAFFKCGSGRKGKSWKREAGIWDSCKTMRRLWFLILRRLIWASVYTVI